METDGLIFDIRRFAVHDGPGIRTTVFMKGCPLACHWCHNPESQNTKSENILSSYRIAKKTFKHQETAGKVMTVHEVMQDVLKDRVFFESSGGGVTFSGGEPLMQEAFLIELLEASRSLGLHTALDTSGYTTKNVIMHIAPLVDLFLFDIKLVDESLHKKYTGASNKLIIENLLYLSANGFDIRLRFPVIPGITDTANNINDLKALIRLIINNRSEAALSNALSIDLLPYHHSAIQKYRRLKKENYLPQLPLLKDEEIQSVKKEIESVGIRVSIGG